MKTDHYLVVAIYFYHTEVRQIFEGISYVETIVDDNFTFGTYKVYFDTTESMMNFQLRYL